MAVSKIPRSYGDSNNFHITSAHTNSSSGLLSFNLNFRGAGIALISQNARNSSVYAITVSYAKNVNCTKIMGSDVTINSSDPTNVTFEVANWSIVTIISNETQWNAN